MNILQNFSLKQYNTFGIDAYAQYFASFSNVGEAQQLLGDKRFSSISKFILGGGSNILLTKNIEGLVLKNEIKGIELIKEDKRHVYVKVAAGENWNSFVMHCIQHNYAGLENLSLIPGNVGASPMQNIGAYGVELKEVFESLEALNRNHNRIVEFTVNDCAFGYRESVFKRKYKDQFIILNVIFRLNKVAVFNTSYGAVAQELERMNVKELSIKAVSQAVINIRTSKLPDPKQIGNAGSFFKNPTIELKAYQLLQHSYFNIPHYAVDDSHVKIPAAWLIEQCGWKGYRDGAAGVHPKQPLVLVNYGNASGKQIYDLSEKILQNVKQKFGIELEREVNIV